MKQYENFHVILWIANFSTAPHKTMCKTVHHRVENPIEILQTKKKFKYEKYGWKMNK